MKRSELLFSTLLLPIDAAMIFAAFLLSYYLRVESGALRVSTVLPLPRYILISLLITAVWLVIFAAFGLYALRSTRRGLTEFYRISAGVSVGTLTVIAVIFFLRINFFSRLVVVLAFVAALVLVTLARSLMRLLQRFFFRYGIGVRRALVVGTGRTAKVLAAELTRADRGYRILGFVATDRGQTGREVVGQVGAIAKLITAYRPDELIDAEPRLSGTQKLTLVDAVEDAGIDFRYTSTMAELATSHVDAVAIAGVPIMTVRRTPLEGWGRVLKRALDLTVSLIVLLPVLLVYVVVAIAIKLDSRGPVIFKQTRAGRQGKPFTFYKFRSMVADAESQLAALQDKNELTGALFKIKNDPRVTRVGRVLRKTSLDELPQIFNVLKGEMSLVGPRPPLPSEVAQYDRTTRRRLTVKPGITGPWQVSGRNDVSFEEYVRLDVYYIQNWSLLLDLTILLKTVGVVLTRKGAY